MAYEFRRQPLKGLFLAYQFLSTLFIRVPLWALLAIPSSLRPRKSWSLKRTVIIKTLRHLGYVSSRSGPLRNLPNHLSITQGVGFGGIWVEPVPQLITGQLKIWMTAASVSAVRIPGYWVHDKDSSYEYGTAPHPGEKVLYHLHGGAYIRLSAHPTDMTAIISRGIVQHTKSIHRSFAIEYRLSSSEPFPVANPFPAALLDALAGYNYLINDVGFSPSDVVIVGDSAGGNLAHALVRYLVEYKDAPDINLPSPPGALILLSPWSDLSSSHEGPGSSNERFAQSDYLFISKGINYAKDSFLGPLGLGAAFRNRYISPSSLDPAIDVHFGHFPRTFIVSGGAEVLFDQISTLHHRMIRDLGDDMVQYYEAKDGVHDYLVFGWHEPERTETLEAISKWIDT